MGVAAFGIFLLASPLNSDPLRQLPLRGPQKFTAGPLLGFVSGRGPTSAVKLVRIDPRTLRPSGPKSVRLPFADAWAVAPGGRTLALAVHPDPINEPNSLKLVKLPSLQLQTGSLRLGGDVSALAWTSPHQVVALVGEILCCPAQLSVVVANLQTRRVVRREPVGGTVLHIARWAHGLVLLTGPTGTIGPASLVVADAHGVRATKLAPIQAGEIPGGGGVSEWQLPGLAVDAAGTEAYVVDPDGAVATIDLKTLAVSEHQPTTRRSFLARLDGWLEPSAAAKGDSGPVRQAQWIGNGFVLLAGSNLLDTERQLASDPAGLELIDTRSWTVYVLAPQADSFTVANGLVLVTGARWRGNVNPTGMGLEAYGPDRRRRFGLFAGHDVWIDHVANGRAYVAGYGWNNERIIDLSTRRIIGTRTTAPAPTLLLGLGNPLG
jgi:DNA-binding beta-propeller fold protein YncE